MKLPYRLHMALKELEINTTTATPDWDAARAGIAELDYDDVELLDFTLSPLLLSKGITLDSEDYLEAAQEIIREDLEAVIGWVESGVAETVEVDGVHVDGFTRESGEIVARGPEHPESAEQALTPVWRTYRTVFSGILGLSGLID